MHFLDEMLEREKDILANLQDELKHTKEKIKNLEKTIDIYENQTLRGNEDNG